MLLFLVIGGETMKNRLRELRKEKGLTLNELSNELLERLNFKIGSNALGKYERGEREPKLATWSKLANFFGVSIGYIQGTSEIRASSYNASDPFSDFYNNLSDLQKRDSNSYVAFLKDISTKSFEELCQVLNTVRHFSPVDVEKNKELISSIDSVGVMSDFVDAIEQLFKLSLYAYNGDRKARSALNAIKKVIYDDYLELDNDDDTKAIASYLANELDKR